MAKLLALQGMTLCTNRSAVVEEVKLLVSTASHSIPQRFLDEVDGLEQAT